VSDLDSRAWIGSRLGRARAAEELIPMAVAFAGRFLSEALPGRHLKVKYSRYFLLVEYVAEFTSSSLMFVWFEPQRTANTCGTSYSLMF
jgi:hypothetical protein